jgi:hypothetical protein
MERSIVKNVKTIPILQRLKGNGSVRYAGNDLTLEEILHIMEISELGWHYLLISQIEFLTYARKRF